MDQNKDSKTLHFKLCVGSEAIDRIPDGRKALCKKPQGIRLTHVDNCYSVSESC